MQYQVVHTGAPAYAVNHFYTGGTNSVYTMQYTDCKATYRQHFVYKYTSVGYPFVYREYSAKGLYRFQYDCFSEIYKEKPVVGMMLCMHESECQSDLMELMYPMHEADIARHLIEFMYPMHEGYKKGEPVNFMAPTHEVDYLRQLTELIRPAGEIDTHKTIEFSYFTHEANCTKAVKDFIHFTYEAVWYRHYIDLILMSHEAMYLQPPAEMMKPVNEIQQSSLYSFVKIWHETYKDSGQPLNRCFKTAEPDNELAGYLQGLYGIREKGAPPALKYLVGLQEKDERHISQRIYTDIKCWIDCFYDVFTHSAKKTDDFMLRFPEKNLAFAENLELFSRIMMEAIPDWQCVLSSLIHEGAAEVWRLATWTAHKNGIVVSDFIPEKAETCGLYDSMVFILGFRMLDTINDLLSLRVFKDVDTNEVFMPTGKDTPAFIKIQNEIYLQTVLARLIKALPNAISDRYGEAAVRNYREGSYVGLNNEIRPEREDYEGLQEAIDSLFNVESILAHKDGKNIAYTKTFLEAQQDNIWPFLRKDFKDSLSDIVLSAFVMELAEIFCSENLRALVKDLSLCQIVPSDLRSDKEKKDIDLNAAETGFEKVQKDARSLYYVVQFFKGDKEAMVADEEWRAGQDRLNKSEKTEESVGLSNSVSKKIHLTDFEPVIKKLLLNQENFTSDALLYLYKHTEVFQGLARILLQKLSGTAHTESKMTWSSLNDIREVNEISDVICASETERDLLLNVFECFFHRISKDAGAEQFDEPAARNSSVKSAVEQLRSLLDRIQLNDLFHAADDEFLEGDEDKEAEDIRNTIILRSEIKSFFCDIASLIGTKAYDEIINYMYIQKGEKDVKTSQAYNIGCYAEGMARGLDDDEGEVLEKVKNNDGVRTSSVCGERAHDARELHETPVEAERETAEKSDITQNDIQLFKNIFEDALNDYTLYDLMLYAINKAVDAASLIQHLEKFEAACAFSDNKD